MEPEQDTATNIELPTILEKPDSDAQIAPDPADRVQHR